MDWNLKKIGQVWTWCIPKIAKNFVWVVSLSKFLIFNALMLCELCFQKFWHFNYWATVFLSAYCALRRPISLSEARFRWQIWVQGITKFGSPSKLLALRVVLFSGSCSETYYLHDSDILWLQYRIYMLFTCYLHDSSQQFTWNLHAETLYMSMLFTCFVSI